MKYIRTKDTIIYPDHEDNSFWYLWDEDKKAFLVALKQEIIKQADTIEELCDEFVIDNKIVRYEYNELSFEGLKVMTKTNEIYGAIWTDKGLIYVAKMNDKGELELL